MIRRTVRIAWTGALLGLLAAGGPGTSGIAEAGRTLVLDDASRALMQFTGIRSLRGFTANERLAWQRWSPFVLALPGVQRWSAADWRAVARVLRAKGGRRESDFAALFGAHPRLVRALYAQR